MRKDVKVGLGLFSNFGLGMNYDSDWVGRYYALENTLIGVSVTPGASIASPSSGRSGLRPTS